jgi:hypothetical protein
MIGSAGADASIPAQRIMPETDGDTPVVGETFVTSWES